MILEKIQPIFIKFTGKACFFELMMKLLVNRDGTQVNKISCKEVKKIMYEKFSKYFTKEDKKIINEAVWIRNKLVHFEFSEILKIQESIKSEVVEGTINPKDSSSIFNSLQKMLKGESSPVNKDSHLFGLCLEFGSNCKRVQELNETLDKATNIVKQITNESIKE